MRPMWHGCVACIDVPVYNGYCPCTQADTYTILNKLNWPKVEYVRLWMWMWMRLWVWKDGCSKAIEMLLHTHIAIEMVTMASLFFSYTSNELQFLFNLCSFECPFNFRLSIDKNPVQFPWHSIWELCLYFELKKIWNGLVRIYLSFALALVNDSLRLCAQFESHL